MQNKQNLSKLKQSIPSYVEQEKQFKKDRKIISKAFKKSEPKCKCGRSSNNPGVLFLVKSCPVHGIKSEPKNQFTNVNKKVESEPKWEKQIDYLFTLQGTLNFNPDRFKTLFSSLLSQQREDFIEELTV